MLKLSGKLVMVIDRNGINPMKYTVYVNDLQFLLAICIKIQVDHPYLCFCPIWNCCEPLNMHTDI